MVCGDTIVWKGSHTTPLTSIATTKIVSQVLERNGIPGAVATLTCGGTDVGETIVNDKRYHFIKKIINKNKYWRTN